MDSSAARFIVIADASKYVDRLGSKTAVPVEVLPIARTTVMRRIKIIGGEPKLRDGGDRKDGPLVTDNGNFIIDANFGKIADARTLEFELKRIPGIVEVGLFINMAHSAFLGDENGVRRLDRKK